MRTEAVVLEPVRASDPLRARIRHAARGVGHVDADRLRAGRDEPRAEHGADATGAGHDGAMSLSSREWMFIMESASRPVIPDLVP